MFYLYYVSLCSALELAGFGMVVSEMLWFAACQGCWAEHPVVLAMPRGATRRCLLG